MNVKIIAMALFLVLASVTTSATYFEGQGFDELDCSRMRWVSATGSGQVTVSGIDTLIVFNSESTTVHVVDGEWTRTSSYPFR